MRVLCSSGITNDLGLPARLLPVAAELRSRGHEIAFANPAPAASRLIGEAGFPNLAWPVPLDPLAPRKVTLPVQFPLADAEQAMCLIYGDPDYTATEVRNWQDLIRQWGADVLLDSFGPAGCAAALIERIPLVEVLQSDFHPESRFTREAPPHGSLTAAGNFNRLLSQSGIREFDLVTRLTVAGSSIVAGSASTDPVPDPALPYAGALGWGDPDAALPESVPRPGKRPLVFLYGGNPDYTGGKESGVVVDAAVEALGSLDMDVVLAAGNQPYPDDLPANFTALPYVTGSALARRADLMIHHGGHGSYLTALAAGIPAVAIPTYSERESIGRRLAATGAGLCLVPEGDQFSGQTLAGPLLRDAVTSVLNDPGYRRAAQRIKAELAALPGAAGVADLVEAAIGRSLPT